MQLSLMVKDILESQGVTVHMSRTTDINVTLEESVRLANDSGADLFISIHHNSNNPFKKGTEVYYPLQERHGDRSDESLQIAKIINDLVHNNTSLKKRGIHEGNYVVLNGTNMPAILTETGYMGGDIHFLKHERNLKKVAEGIAQGILESFGECS